MHASNRRAAYEHDPRPNVIVVGGGISGLAAAERLIRAPRAPRLTLLEASCTLGGCVGTDHVNGFVMERGPDVFLATTPVVLDLCERVGIADRVIAPRREAAGSYVLRSGRLVRDAAPPRPLYSGAGALATGARPELRSLRGGLGTLIDAVSRAITPAGVEIRTGVSVTSCDGTANAAANGSPHRVRVSIANGEILDADAAILAIPAPAAATLLASIDASLAAELRAITCASLTIVTLAYGPSASTSTLDATGYTVPPDEGRAVLACTWSSSKLDGRAPDRHSLFRVFFGGAHGVDPHRCRDGVLIGMARAELRDTLGITAAPLLTRVVRWIDAMPRYDAEHAARMARVEHRVAGLPAIVLAGNAYEGVGIPDCVRSGVAAAERVLDLLAR